MRQVMRKHVCHVDVCICSLLVGSLDLGHQALDFGLEVFTRFRLFIVNVVFEVPSFRSVLA